MLPYSVDTEPRKKIFFYLAVISVAIATCISTQLKSVSLGGLSAGTAFAVLFFLFDRYLWRAPGLSGVVGIPNLNGDWKGILHVNVGGAPGQLNVSVTVIQRWTTINLLFDGPTLKSRARLVGISMATPNDVRLVWVYVCEPKISGAPPNIVDAGVTDVDVTIGEEGGSMAGVYYSRNRNIGEISLRR